MSDQVFGPRRRYNRFVSNQTLEDHSLRYTPHGFRKRGALTVTNAAVGSVSFLALEAIGANIAIYYGFNHLLLAILIGMPLMFLISAPIAIYAVRCHTDIDLLTRGAGFGYLGSSITSLIYASFTFIFLAFEAAILAQLLK
ncbi:MAG: hybrid sensor histidine kinase/response regulator, partial [Succinivibrio sp.]